MKPEVILIFFNLWIFNLLIQYKAQVIGDGHSFNYSCNINSQVSSNLISLELQFEPKYKFYYHPDSNTVGELSKLDIQGFQYTSGLPRSTSNPIGYKRPIYIYYEESVKGLGARARVIIRKGEEIGVYAGQIINKVKADYLLDNSKGDYIMLAGNDKFIDAKHMGNECRFVNHWCSNYNTDIYLYKEGIVVLVAIRDISPGEIISYSYMSDFTIPIESRYEYIQNCSCPSSKHILGVNAVISIN